MPDPDHATPAPSPTTVLPTSSQPGPSLVASFAARPQRILTNWKPQPDITAYELATCLPYLIARPITLPEWEALGPANRHMPRR